VPSLVVLRALALGDLLTGLPALRALRRAHPDHRIVLAAPDWAGPIVRGAVDEVLPCTSPQQVAGRFPQPVDVAVNLHGRGPASHHALDGLRARRRVGVAGPPGWDGPDHDATLARHRHERELWCAVLAAHRIPADPTDLRLPPPPPTARVVVVHPGAAYGAKRWPAARFAAVARTVDRQVPVVVTGTAGELPLARRVGALAGLPVARVLAGRTDLPQLCALVGSAAAVVCGDTGVAHLASAYATPSVVLFGPVPADRWGPPPGPHVALERPLARRGDPFASTPDPALTAIGVDEVRAALRRVAGIG